ncbi:monovalent cation:proton antiporter-2 (CPA2) family protein [Marinimicrobium sp. ARAG 43.8]|uniref:monovalent cation:proton antiporter-2 (CPA2) family protein n=1 Tax=Marinimicrobium sp. ARAG 43.8 TaxID=3418719 RepID=UPI003CE78602
MQHFLTDAAVYLCAAVIVVTLSKRLGFGSVLGYLIAGSLLGPHVLNFVSHPESVLNFAEFGVVIMLFLIGLELRPQRLWSLRRAILGMGGAQVVLSAFVVSGAVWLFGVPMATALLVGMTLALSSTAIVLQTLEERGLLNSSVGQHSFSVLLFQDIAVIPILALIPLLASASGGHAEATDQGSLLGALPEYLQAIVTVLGIVGLVLVARYGLRPVFRLIAGARQPELFTGFVLLIVVGVTLAMTAIGLSPALGAFIAGVVLAESEFRHEIEADLNPFKGLLMGLFFLSVGASIDYPLLKEHPLVVLGAATGLMALKFVVLYGIGSLFQFGRSEKILFGISLSQGGEFAFVISAAGLTAGVLSQGDAELLNLVVAVTMVGTALLFMAFEHLPFHKPVNKPHYDTPTPSKGVIIAGYGRFGQIVGRMMNSDNIPMTILDNNPGQVDLLRRFGSKVFYGDASRRTLLEQAGAADAALLVVAVDDVNRSLSIVDTARKHFPDLKIIARAVDRNHAYHLRERGIQTIRRETFHSALKLGEDALTALGQTPEQATAHARRFAEHDERTFEELAPIWGDDERYGKAVYQNLENLRQVLEEDRQQKTPNETVRTTDPAS